MADVVVSVGDLDVEAGVGRPAEFLAGDALLPAVAARELVLAAAGHALHDLGRAGVEGELGGQHDTDRLSGAVSQGDGVAHALAVEIHIGLRRNAGAVDFFGGHRWREKGAILAPVPPRAGVSASDGGPSRSSSRS